MWHTVNPARHRRSKLAINFRMSDVEERFRGIRENEYHCRRLLVVLQIVAGVDIPDPSRYRIQAEEIDEYRQSLKYREAGSGEERLFSYLSKFNYFELSEWRSMREYIVDMMEWQDAGGFCKKQAICYWRATNSHYEISVLF